MIIPIRGKGHNIAWLLHPGLELAFCSAVSHLVRSHSGPAGAADYAQPRPITAQQSPPLIVNPTPLRGCFRSVVPWPQAAAAATIHEIS
jgi:hypothetical protein